MAEFAPRSMKRKNVKGLALTPAAPKAPPTASTNAPAGLGWGTGGSKHEDGSEAQLEIGIEFNLSLKQEDLEIIKELGSGNGGTVSKIKHLPTGTTMARKVRYRHRLSPSVWAGQITNTGVGHPCRGKEGNAAKNCA
jgi:mitogen-activated protein kinase kinase